MLLLTVWTSKHSWQKIGMCKKTQGEAADAVWFRASDPSAPLSVVVVGGGAVNGTNQLNPPTMLLPHTPLLQFFSF